MRRSCIGRVKVLVPSATAPSTFRIARSGTLLFTESSKQSDLPLSEWQNVRAADFGSVVGRCLRRVLVDPPEKRCRPNLHLTKNLVLSTILERVWLAACIPMCASYYLLQRSSRLKKRKNPKGQTQRPTGKETLPVRKTKSIFNEIDKMHERIMHRAHDIFLANGGVFGKDLENWLSAERELVWKPAIELREKGNEFLLTIGRLAGGSRCRWDERPFKACTCRFGQRVNETRQGSAMSGPSRARWEA